MEIRNNEFLILSVPYSPEDVEYGRGDCDCGGKERVNALEYVKIPI